MLRELAYKALESLDKRSYFAINISVKECDNIVKYIESLNSLEDFNQKLLKYGYEDIYQYRKGLANGEKSAKGECQGFIIGYVHGISLYNTLIQFKNASE